MHFAKMLEGCSTEPPLYNRKTFETFHSEVLVHSQRSGFSQGQSPYGKSRNIVNGFGTIKEYSEFLSEYVCLVTAP